MGYARRFSPPLSLSLSFIEMFVLRFGNDTYRYRYRSSIFSAVIIQKLFEFQYPTLYARYSALSRFGLLDRDVEISCVRTFGAAASGHNGFRSSGWN